MDISKYVKYTKIISQYFGASLIPMLLNLAINPLVSLAMEPEDFAIVGYYTSYSTLISPIIVFYMIHYYNKRYFELDEAGRLQLKALLFKALIFFSFAVSFICLIFLFAYITFFTSNSFPKFPYLYMVILSIPLSGIYSLELAEFKMKRESKKYMNFSVMKGVTAVAFTLLFVVLLKLGAFGKLLGPIIIDAALFVYLIHKNVNLFKVKTCVADLLPVLKFCAPLTVGAALGYFSNGYDKNVLEGLGNVTEFGYYCVGASIAGYLSVFTNSLNATFQPDLYEAIIQKNRRKLFKVSALRIFLTLIVVLVFILACPLIIEVLTAGKYIASTRYARIFAFIPLTSSIYYIVNDYTIARGKPYFYLITTMIGSAITIVLMPYAVSGLGFDGGASMMVINFVILTMINISILIFNKWYRKLSSSRSLRINR